MSAFQTAKSYTSPKNRYHELPISIPYLLVVNDNGISISERNYHSVEEHLKQFGFKVFTADSLNIFQVYSEAKKAISTTRSLKKHVALVIKTTRNYGHSSNSQNQAFSDSEQKELVRNVPIIYCMDSMIKANVLTLSQCKDLYTEIVNEVKTLSKQISEEPKTTGEMILKFYEIPPHIRKFRLKERDSFKQFTISKMIGKLFTQTMEENPNVIDIGQDRKSGRGHYGTVDTQVNFYFYFYFVFINFFRFSFL